MRIVIIAILQSDTPLVLTPSTVSPHDVSAALHTPVPSPRSPHITPRHYSGKTPATPSQVHCDTQQSRIPTLPIVNNQPVPTIHIKITTWNINRLPVGKMVFESSHLCPYCKVLFIFSTPREYFLSFSSSSSTKHSRLNSINKTLSPLDTPPLLQQHIFLSLSKFYNIDFCSTKYSHPSPMYASSEVY